jgi:hypothetical protein
MCASTWRLNTLPARAFARRPPVRNSPGSPTPNQQSEEKHSLVQPSLEETRNVGLFCE